MHTTRRKFLKAAAYSGSFVAARFHGLPLRGPAQTFETPCFLHTGAGYAPFIEQFVKLLQPGADAFVTEKYVAQLALRLNAWQTFLLAPLRHSAAVDSIFAATLIASPLDKPVLKPMRTELPLQSDSAVFSPPEPIGKQDFFKVIERYLQPLESIQIAELQIDGFSIDETTPLRVTTRIHYDLVGTLDPSRREERTGEWELTWQGDSESNWTIVQWSAERELRSRLTGPAFVDITATSFAGAPSYEQLRLGVDHWRTVLDGASGIDIYGNHGVAIGDFDGDGFDDLYVCQPAGLPNRLYRNRGDGTFEDVTDKAGVDVLDGTSSAIFADLNNNGHQDLIVVRTSGPLLFVNRGNGTFQLRPDAFRFAQPPQGTFTGIGVADYDGDGLLDIYFCLYSFYQGLSEYEYPMPYYDAQNGPPNFLLRNHGNYSFEDVTAASGMNQNNNRFSFVCGWNDYDNDGHLDLCVVNDFGRKNLYHNNGDGTFVDVSAKAGVEDPGAGMSVCWFDYDNDGYDDLYIANMWSAAGKRISTQQAFMPATTDKIRGAYRKHANGNSLFHNTAGSGVFRDTTEESGTRIGRWSWGSDAWDFDHDGSPDLYVTNGFISGPEQDNLSSFFWRQIVARSLTTGGDSKEYGDAWSAINEFIRSDHSWSGYQRNNFYMNNRNGEFTEAAGILGLDFLDDSRSFALADLDRDGRLEVVLKNRTGPQLRVLHNDLTPLHPSISFALEGTKSNRDAIGAVVELETGEIRQRNTIRAGSGYLTQHSKVLCFGLGTATGPLRATVLWPSGAKQHFLDLPAGHLIRIKEGTAAFNAEAYKTAVTQRPAAASTLEGDLASSYQTWLVEPILPPDFRLTDQHGKSFSLKDSLQQPLVVIFCGSDCTGSQAQLDAMQKAWPEWQQHSVGAVAVRVESAAGTGAGSSPSATDSFSFPVLAADERTSAVYNIFHRYLYERRREMMLPTSFLIDREGFVIKVYSGLTSPANILQDWLSAPASTEDRLKRALPFDGRYFGNGLHHNYFTYGVAFLQYNYLDEALASFQQSIARNPSYAAAYYNVGLIYLNKGAFSDARVNLAQAVQLDGKNADAWNNLGVVYGQQGDYASAQKDFQRAIDLQPTHVLALQNLVKLYRFQGHLDTAKDVLQRAIAINPSEAELHQGLAMLLVEQKDLSQAQQEFEQVVRLQPDNVEGLNGLGVVLMQLGNGSDAMRRFEECTKVAPSFDRPYLNMAVLYMSAGQPGKAHDILSQFLAGQPDNADIRQALQEVDGSK